MKDARFVLGAFVSMIAFSVLLIPLMGRAMTVVDPNASRVSVGKTTLRADGIDNTQLAITVRDTNLDAMPGVAVTVLSDRGSLDEIRVEKGTTDELGKAYFRIFSLKDGVAIFRVNVNGVTLAKTITITFSGGLAITLKPGDLIKIPDDGNAKTLSDTAVYYYAPNGKRYVFPNEKTYFTWYQDFGKVRVIPIDQMSLIPIGGNVTHRPGTRMVKFQTDVKTYIVTRGGTLRWVTTEQVARGWFGTEWNTHIDDVSEAFYANYTFGKPVENPLDLSLDIVRNDVQTIARDKGLE